MSGRKQEASPSVASRTDAVLATSLKLDDRPQAIIRVRKEQEKHLENASK